MTDPITGIGPILAVPIEVIIIGGTAVAIIAGVVYITYKTIRHFRSQKRKIVGLTRQSAAQAEKTSQGVTQNDELKAQTDQILAQNADLLNQTTAQAKHNRST